MTDLLPASFTDSDLPARIAAVASAGHWSAALAIARRLQEAGHAALIVGGAVRNALLGLPVKDIDIATSAPPEAVAELFAQARSVGAHFGVQLVTLSEAGDAATRHTFEIATFRAEGSYVDFRRPESVRYGTLEEDVARRDFTVNALYYEPVAERLVDLVGGVDDLRVRRLRTVGEPAARFGEDALRLLRAVRFAVRYGLEIEPATAAAIRAHAGLLVHISPERIADELVRMLTGPDPGRAMHLMQVLGLWGPTIPEIEPMAGCEQPPNFHPEGDVFVHTAMVLDEARRAWHELRGPQAGDPPPELALGALLHDVGKPPTFSVTDRIRFTEHQKVGARMAEAICQRLRLSTATREQVVALVENHMRFMEVRRMKRSTLRRFLALPRFDEHLALHRADCMGSNGFTENYDFCRAALAELAQEEPGAAALPPPLLRGRDLIEAGLTPGPQFKELLDAAMEEQLEGRLTTHEEAQAWLATRMKA